MTKKKTFWREEDWWKITAEWFPSSIIVDQMIVRIILIGNIGELFSNGWWCGLRIDWRFVFIDHFHFHIRLNTHSTTPYTVTCVNMYKRKTNALPTTTTTTRWLFDANSRKFTDEEEFVFGKSKERSRDWWMFVFSFFFSWTITEPLTDHSSDDEGESVRLNREW